MSPSEINSVALRCEPPVNPRVHLSLVRAGSSAEIRPIGQTDRVVGLGGLEPPTSCVSDMRSNQLSYSPNVALPEGFEPYISALRGQRPNLLDYGSRTWRLRGQGIPMKRTRPSHFPPSFFCSLIEYRTERSSPLLFGNRIRTSQLQEYCRGDPNPLGHE